MSNLEVGVRFESLEAGKTAVLTWAIESGVSFKVHKATAAFWIARCKARDCPFRIRIQKDKDGARVTKMEEHTCPYSTHQNFRQAHSVAYLAPVHRAAVVDNRAITPRQIQSNERLQQGNRISYMQAWRTIEKLRKEVEGDGEKAFRKLPRLLDAMFAGDGNTVTRLDTIDGKFVRCFIALAATRFAFLHCRKFLALDGTFITSRYRMTLLVAATIDANNETLPLCWALVPSGNLEQWTWFMSNFVEAFMDFSLEPNTVVISDREKGIEEAVNQHLPLATHAHCCQYIADNVQQKFGKQCRDLFWPIAYARTEMEFEIAVKKLRELKEDAGDYLDKIPRDRWTTLAFPLPRYRHLISNIIESVNVQWLDIRDLPVLHLLSRLWTTMMAKFFERYHRQQKTPRLTDYAYEFLHQQGTIGRNYYVIPSDNDQAMVVSAKDGHHRIINLALKTCTCLEFQDQGIPCRHACAMCTEYHRDAEKLVDMTVYSIQVYQDTYQHSLAPFLLEDLTSDSDCAAPFTAPQ